MSNRNRNRAIKQSDLFAVTEDGKEVHFEIKNGPDDGTDQFGIYGFTQTDESDPPVIEAVFENDSAMHKVIDWQTNFLKLRVGSLRLPFWNKETVPNEPPPAAEFLLAMFIPKKRRDAILGDLDERFARDCETVGFGRARRRYWGYVLNSVIPLAWSGIKKFRVFAYLIAAKKIFFS